MAPVGFSFVSLAERRSTPIWRGGCHCRQLKAHRIHWEEGSVLGCIVYNYKRRTPIHHPRNPVAFLCDYTVAYPETAGGKRQPSLSLLQYCHRFSGRTKAAGPPHRALFLQGPVYTIRIRVPCQVYPGPCKKSKLLPRFISPQPPCLCPVARFRSDGNRGMGPPSQTWRK
jgi:hypothetical protein